MSLKDIIGQKRAVEMLLGIIQRQRIANSYLFCGESGIGKKTAAINFAKALNCQKTPSSRSGEPSGAAELQTPNLFDACDECDSCQKIDAGTHPDFLLVLPEERLIRIEEIRLIDDALSFKPFEGRNKIVIVDDADTMNINAANAFLKTLEEPPADSVIILISSKPDLLPDTIRSRCSRINFIPLSSELCRQVLKGKVPEESLEFAARLSMGRPGIALSVDLIEEKTWFLDLFNDMLNDEKDGWTSRDDMERWFEILLTFLRDMAVFKITGNAAKLINSDLHEYMRKLSKFTDLKVILYIHGELSQLKNLLKFNLNKSVTWNFTASLLRKELSV